MKWYVVHTHASHEFKIKEAIERGMKENKKLSANINQILIPTQKTFHIRNGKRVEREKKLFNSYIIIEAELIPEVYTFIKGLPTVTHFLGDGKKPQPLTDKEVKRLLGIADRDYSDKKEINLIQGDMVKIIGGPFSDFDGVVEKIHEDKINLTVKVTVFGRVTPVEVKAEQVEIVK